MLIPTHTVMTFSYLPIHGSWCYALSIKYELSLICPRKSVLSGSLAASPVDKKKITKRCYGFFVFRAPTTIESSLHLLVGIKR